MRAIFVGVLLSALAFAVSAQEAEDAAVEEETAAPAEAEERDALEPGVSSNELVAARRIESDNGVMDEIDLGRTEITGNQELPKVLYIVPWQKSDPGDLMGRPVNTLLDEVLAPVDRGEFVRQVRYYGELQDEQSDAARE